MEENLVWKSCITAKSGTKDGGGSLLYTEEAMV